MEAYRNTNRKYLHQIIIKYSVRGTKKYLWNNFSGLLQRFPVFRNEIQVGSGGSFYKGVSLSLAPVRGFPSSPRSRERLVSHGLLTHLNHALRGSTPHRVVLLLKLLLHLGELLHLLELLLRLLNLIRILRSLESDIDTSGCHQPGSGAILVT